MLIAACYYKLQDRKGKLCHIIWHASKLSSYNVTYLGTDAKLNWSYFNNVERVSFICHICLPPVPFPAHDAQQYCLNVFEVHKFGSTSTSLHRMFSFKSEFSAFGILSL